MPYYQRRRRKFRRTVKSVFLTLAILTLAVVVLDSIYNAAPNW